MLNCRSRFHISVVAQQVFHGIAKCEGLVTVECSSNSPTQLRTGIAGLSSKHSHLLNSRAQMLCIRARLPFQFHYTFLNVRSCFYGCGQFSKLFPAIWGATAIFKLCMSPGLLPNLRCTGQHKLFSSWIVISQITGSRIFKGRISSTRFL